MPRVTSEKKGHTVACPACDRGGQVYQRKGRGNTEHHPERPYRCEHCSVALHYVIERPKRGWDGTGQQTLINDRGANTATKLAAMSPEEAGLSAMTGD